MTTGNLALARTGTQTGADGSELPLTLMRDGSLRGVHAHARYQDAVQKGNVYHASNAAAQAVSVALATTYTGIMLSNAVSSSKDLVVWDIGWVMSVAEAAIASIHIIGGSSATDVTHTAAITPVNCFLGNTNTGAGKVDSQATIPTPKYMRGLMSGFTAAALGAKSPLPGTVDGMFILGPGSFLGIGALTAVTGFGHIVWEEVTHYV